MRDDTGHRTATIPRPVQPAADKRASEPQRRDPEREPRPRRRYRIALGLLAAVVAGSLGASVLILPVKAWLNQRDELGRRETELADLDAENAQLAADVKRLETTKGVMEAAREELGVVNDDEKVYRVLTDPAIGGALPEGWLFPTIGALLEARSLGVPMATAPDPAALDPAAEPVTSG